MNSVTLIGEYGSFKSNLLSTAGRLVETASGSDFILPPRILSDAVPPNQAWNRFSIGVGTLPIEIRGHVNIVYLSRR